MGRCSRDKCPSSRRCRNPEKRSPAPRFPACTFRAIFRRHASRKCRSWRWEFLRRREGNRRLQVGKKSLSVGGILALRKGGVEQARSQTRTNPAAAASAAAKSLRGRGGGAWKCFGGGFALELHFLRRTFLAPSAVVGNRQLVVPCGILRHDLHVSLQRRDRVGEFLGGSERHPQREISFGEAGVETRRRRKMGYGLVPLAGTAHNFPSRKFRCRVARID